MVLEIAGGLFGQDDVRETATVATSQIGGNIIMGKTISVSPLQTRYYIPFGEGTQETTLTQANILIPSTGTLRNLRANVAANTLNNITNVTIWVNNATTGITVQYGGGVTGALSDLTNTFVVAAGDLLSIKSVTTANGGAMSDLSWGFELNTT